MVISLALEMAFEPTLTAPAQARAGIESWLQSEHASPELAEVAALLVSELVTNSVRHAELVSDRPLRLRGRLDPTTLHLEVSDGGTSGTVEQRAAKPGSGGLGLELVDRLARGWGVDRDAVGTTVWLDLPIE